MKVIIVGCGRIGSSLADRLYKKDHHITVIDQNASAFDSLSIDFHGRTVEGDALAQNVLHRAEIEHADALTAVTRSDTLNALVAHIARTEYHVSRVVARNYDPRQRPLQEAFDISVVGSAGWGVQRIEELLSNGPLHAVLLDSNANFSIYRLEVPEIWHGRPLQELLPESPERRGHKRSQGGSKVLSWTRAGRSLAISFTKPVKARDLIYLNADSREIDALRHRLGLQRPGGILQEQHT